MAETDVSKWKLSGPITLWAGMLFAVGSGFYSMFLQNDQKDKDALMTKIETVETTLNGKIVELQEEVDGNNTTLHKRITSNAERIAPLERFDSGVQVSLANIEKGIDRINRRLDAAGAPTPTTNEDEAFMKKMKKLLEEMMNRE